MTGPDYLTRARAILAASTPGPWLPSHGPSTHGVYCDDGEIVDRLLSDRPAADARALVLARNAIAALLAEHEALREPIRRSIGAPRHNGPVFWHLTCRVCGAQSTGPEGTEVEHDDECPHERAAAVLRKEVVR